MWCGALLGVRVVLFGRMWAVMVPYVSEERLGEVHGRVGDEEEVAGEGEEGEEGDEGRAVFYTVLSGNADGVEEGEREGHGLGEIWAGIGRMKGGMI